MNAIEFMPFHNKHIKFQLTNGISQQGVLIDPMNSHETDKPASVYTFIPTSNMVEWKRAEENKDEKVMKALESEIDIHNITSVIHL